MGRIMTDGDSDRVRIEGSERSVLPGAVRTGDVSPDEAVHVTVLVRPGNADQAITDPETTGSADAVEDPVEARRARRRELAAAPGASQADLARVTSFAADHGLHVDTVDAARRTVRLSGPAQAMTAAFSVDLGHYRA